MIEKITKIWGKSKNMRYKGKCIITHFIGAYTIIVWCKAILVVEKNPLKLVETLNFKLRFELNSYEGKE